MSVQVLVVDDDEDVRDALTSVLEDEGYEVLAVSGGRAALTLLERGARPDVALLDWMMPEMDGLELRRALQADPRLCTLPVVFLTADGRLREHLDDGTVILGKPVRLDELFGALERARASGSPRPPAVPNGLGQLHA